MIAILQIGFAFLLVFAVFCFITVYTLMLGLRLFVQAKNNIEPKIRIKTPYEKWKEKEDQEVARIEMMSKG